MNKYTLLFFSWMLLISVSAFSQSFKQRIDELIESSGGCEYVSILPSDSVPETIPSLVWTELYFLLLEHELNPESSCNKLVKQNDSLFCDIKCEDYVKIKQLYNNWWKRNRRYGKNTIRKKYRIEGALVGSVYKWM